VNVILNTPTNDYWAQAEKKLQDALPVDVVRCSDLLSLDSSVAGKTVALITYGFPAEAVPRLPALSLVGIPMAGINTLPLDALREAGIVVANAHANGRWVAERALALLLAATGRIVSGDTELRRGRWHGFAAGEPPAISWRSLSEMTVAIVGTGSIGQWTARFLRPFGCRIIGVRRRSGIDGIPENLFDAVDTDIEAAFTEADAVIVTLPSTPETVGIVDAHLLKRISGGFLVNVGRGDVIDEGALFRAAAAGSVTCAIDTWFTYPTPPGSRQLPSKYPLETLDTVILSPHLGGYVSPATTASADEIVSIVTEWFAHGRPESVPNAVDLSAGY
jgi:phosphoglycerate dehydrogenase-like enzyme